ncbi:Predicted N-acetyltransferase YhbS [Arboricoccus pini]|uniref:Predicted N-acetyltransferase YhbS n=1 Tax=Arboricoccus pini TaxID=1963835 RepID=A0A212S0J1_9PROT|nr:GNAT family N-acetyltransferase [Arboricoccus pini]SNB78657.1 Predicted N-acetyltransferase YhbS [Arboricoccus pini]
MPVISTKLTYREGHPNRPDRASIGRLLCEVFGLDLDILEELDLREPTYRAFTYHDVTGDCIASAAAFVLPLIVDGRRVPAVGVQSVATRPDWRGQGLSHSLLDRLLRWCDERRCLVFLMTSIPGFYEPMGFRILPQHFFCGEGPAVLPASAMARRLDLGLRLDRQLIATIARRRQPVSRVFALSGMAGAFVLNLHHDSDLEVWHLASHDAIIVIRHEGNALHIVDVVATGIPSLATILAALGLPQSQIVVHFPPDQLGWQGSATLATPPLVLMVRGDLNLPGPVMIPSTLGF